MAITNSEVAAVGRGWRYDLDEDGYLRLEPLAPEYTTGRPGKNAGDVDPRLLPAELVRACGEKLWQDDRATAAEWALCARWDPKHPDTTGLWRWVTRWVWTYDTSDKLHPVKQAPRYAYVAELTRAHMERRAGLRQSHPHLLCVKPRAIWWSWWLAVKNCWSLVFEKRWQGYMMSSKLRRVDDGGRRSSPNSLLGKVRFVYNRLPEFMRLEAPLDFQQGVVRNQRTGSTLVAEVAGDDAGGVGMQVDDGDIDEAGLIPNLEEILAVAAPGARFLTVGGTPRAADSPFHRLAIDSPERTAYRRFDVDWYSVPTRRACRLCGSAKLVEAAAGEAMVDQETGDERRVMVRHTSASCRPQDGCWYDPSQERWTSPWFETKTQGWSEDLKRREFEREWWRASTGRVYKALRRNVHLTSVDKAPVPPDGERWEFWDHGISDLTAVWHIYFDGSVAYLLEYYEAANETAQWWCRRAGWLRGECHRRDGSTWLPGDQASLYLRLWGPPGRHAGLTIRSFGDSAGANRESDGLSWHRRFAQGGRAFGSDGKRYVVGKMNMLSAPKPLVTDRIETAKWAIEDGRAVFVVDPLLVLSRSDAERGYNRLESYHRPLDRNTGAVKETKPVHDAASHGADAFGYAMVKFFGVRHSLGGAI